MIYCPGNCGTEILVCVPKYKGGMCDNCKWEDYLKSQAKQQKKK